MLETVVGRGILASPVVRHPNLRHATQRIDNVVAVFANLVILTVLVHQEVSCVEHPLTRISFHHHLAFVEILHHRFESVGVHVLLVLLSVRSNDGDCDQIYTSGNELFEEFAVQTEPVGEKGRLKSTRSHKLDHPDKLGMHSWFTASMKRDIFDIVCHRVFNPLGEDLEGQAFQKIFLPAAKLFRLRAHLTVIITPAKNLDIQLLDSDRHVPTYEYDEFLQGSISWDTMHHYNVFINHTYYFLHDSPRKKQSAFHT